MLCCTVRCDCKIGDLICDSTMYEWAFVAVATSILLFYSLFFSLLFFCVLVMSLLVCQFQKVINRLRLAWHYGMQILNTNAHAVNVRVVPSTSGCMQKYGKIETENGWKFNEPLYVIYAKLNFFYGLLDSDSCFCALNLKISLHGRKTEDKGIVNRVSTIAA